MTPEQYKDLQKQTSEIYRGKNFHCCGPFPSRPSGLKHRKCGKLVSISFGYRCYYCGFSFCETCAAEHFGMHRLEWIGEFTAFDGALWD